MQNDYLAKNVTLQIPPTKETTSIMNVIALPGIFLIFMTCWLLILIISFIIALLLPLLFPLILIFSPLISLIISLIISILLACCGNIDRECCCCFSAGHWSLCTATKNVHKIGQKHNPLSCRICQEHSSFIGTRLATPQNKEIFDNKDAQLYYP